MPAGVLTTKPDPAPALATVRSKLAGRAAVPQASFEYPESPALLDALTR